MASNQDVTNTSSASTPGDSIDDLRDQSPSSATGFGGDYISKTRKFSRNANLYVIHVIGMDMIHGSFDVLFNLYLLAIGFDIRFIGLRLLIGFIARAVTAIPAGLLSDRIGRKASFILGDGIGAVIGVIRHQHTQRGAPADAPANWGSLRQPPPHLRSRFYGGK